MVKYARRFSVSGYDCHVADGFREAFREAYRDLRTYYRRGVTNSNIVAIVGHKLGGGGIWILQDSSAGLVLEKR